MHEEILGAILDGADEGFIVFDRDGRCSVAGARLGEIFGIDRNALIGGPEPDVLELLCSACEEPETLRELLRDVRKTELAQAEIELKRPTLRIVRWRSIPVSGGWVGIARDVTRERSAERRSSQLLSRLEQITATDALTQLPNRRRFGEELDREHGRAARAWDSYAVLRIDVDNLAALNDEFGQPRGDEVLEHVAARLREGRREYDLLARLGGDEFVLLIPGADAVGTKVVAERMAGAVAREAIDIGEKREVTVTIGAAVWIPPSGENGDDVLERAGSALARAKKKGANQLEIDSIQREPSKAPPPPARPRSSRPPKSS